MRKLGPLIALTMLLLPMSIANGSVHHHRHHPRHHPRRIAPPPIVTIPGWEEPMPIIEPTIHRIRSGQEIENILHEEGVWDTNGDGSSPIEQMGPVEEEEPLVNG